MADALLELSNVETAYGRSQVLFGVSFAIAAGQMVTRWAATAWARPRPCARSWG